MRKDARCHEIFKAKVETVSKSERGNVAWGPVYSGNE